MRLPSALVLRILNCKGEYKMNNRTVGIIVTVITAIVCLCASIFSCVWGILIATNTPLNVTSGGEQSIQTAPAPVGYVLLCLTVIFIAVPIVVGFFMLRNKPAAPSDLNQPIPPAS
jgi:hypothetical protein